LVEVLGPPSDVKAGRPSRAVGRGNGTRAGSRARTSRTRRGPPRGRASDRCRAWATKCWRTRRPRDLGM